MSDKQDLLPMPLSEFFKQNRYRYVASFECLQKAQGYSDPGVVLKSFLLEYIPPDNLCMFLKDYEQYVETHFNL